MTTGAPAGPTFAVYSRPGCHLCERLIEALVPLLRGRASLEVRNVDTHEAWRRRFGTRIPVVESGGEIVCEARLDPEAIERVLAGAEGPQPI